MSCPHLRDDAAYVLGALEPDERQVYEEHLRTCRTCTAAVRSLAGMPGLLARVTPEQVAETERESDHPPPALLTSLLRSTRHERRTSRWRVGVAAAAVAAFTGMGVSAVVLHDVGPDPTRPQEITFQAVNGAPVTASAELSELAWGTRIEMWCEYVGEQTSYPRSYILVVRDKTNGVYELSDWKVIPGQGATISAATALRPEDISSIEVRTDSQTVVARGQP